MLLSRSIKGLKLCPTFAFPVIMSELSKLLFCITLSMELDMKMSGIACPSMAT